MCLCPDFEVMSNRGPDGIRLTTCSEQRLLFADQLQRDDPLLAFFCLAFASVDSLDDGQGVQDATTDAYPLHGVTSEVLPGFPRSPLTSLSATLPGSSEYILDTGRIAVSKENPQKSGKTCGNNSRPNPSTVPDGPIKGDEKTKSVSGLVFGSRLDPCHDLLEFIGQLGTGSLSSGDTIPNSLASSGEASSGDTIPNCLGDSGKSGRASREQALRTGQARHHRLGQTRGMRRQRRLGGSSPGHANAIGAEDYTGKGICFPQTPHLAQAKCLTRASRIVRSRSVGRE